ncbi:MAG: anti-anti-sigma factor [Acidobacteria bacterium]|jgi:anti-sigma B factor antagonist|nr:anti-anti-sigma factor [Acidobacteriota bacterium]
MKIDVRTIRDVYILDCSGKITLGEGTMSIRNTVKDLLQSGAKKILLNLSGITYLDSAGVGELVGCFVTAGNAGGKLKLLGLTGKLREVLTITKLLTVFEVFDNETAAVLSYN